MKLVLITKEDCPYCIEIREIVFGKLIEFMPDLKVEELDFEKDKEKYDTYYDFTDTPACILLSEKNRRLLTIRGLMNVEILLDYINKVSEISTGELTDDELEKVVGGMRTYSELTCDKRYQTCIGN